MGVLIMLVEIFLMIIKILISFILILFLPGYFLSLIILKNISKLERICVSIGLSIVLVVLMGFILTALYHVIRIKTITASNVTILLSILSMIFAIVWYRSERNENG